MKWYIHKPEKVLESEDRKILWDFPIQTDKTFEHNHLDLTFIDKKRKKCLLLNPPCPLDIYDERKEEKCLSYIEL